MRHSSDVKTSLLDLKMGQKARIEGFDSPELQLQLMRMGVVPGDVICLTDMAPLGGPVAVQVHGTKVALRRADARGVFISAMPA